MKGILLGEKFLVVLEDVVVEISIDKIDTETEVIELTVYHSKEKED